MRCFWASISPVLVVFSGIQAQLSCRCPTLVEDQAVHIVGEVGQCDLGLGALDADGADGPKAGL